MKTTIYNDSQQIQRRRLLRREMPAAEVRLWQKIRSRQLLGLRFRRQHSVGPYIVDFYCSQLDLIVELDGDSHASDTALRHDARRDEYLHSLGNTILRFQNSAVYIALESVLTEIACHAPE